MEMYADQDARGGVLEPEGIVGIKFRRERQLETMARLDPLYSSLKSKLSDTALSADQQAEIKSQMTARENLLLPVYAQISLQYADLHDRAGRMKAKDTIRMALTWKNSRRFFYWRLRRRLNEESVLKKMSACFTSTTRDPSSSSSTSSLPLISNQPPPSLPSDSTSSARKVHLITLAAWMGMSSKDFENEDMKVALWYEENRKEVTAKIDAMRSESLVLDVVNLLRSGSVVSSSTTNTNTSASNAKESGKENVKDGGVQNSPAWKGVKQVLSVMPVNEREEIMKFLSTAT